MKKIKGLALTILIGMVIIGTYCIKSIDITEYGTLITFRDNTGYFLEK